MRNICLSLTDVIAKTVASILVNSRFDYASAVLHGTSECNLVKSQRTQNTHARVITFTKHMHHIRPVLQAIYQSHNRLKSGNNSIQSSDKLAAQRIWYNRLLSVHMSF